MFTGIVQGTGCVQSVQGDAVVTVAIEIPSTEGLEVGGSVAIDGVCLTRSVLIAAYQSRLAWICHSHMSCNFPNWHYPHHQLP